MPSLEIPAPTIRAPAIPGSELFTFSALAAVRRLWFDSPVKQMLLPFDIFRVDADGTHRCACVGTLDGAKSRVREFMETWPAEYLVVSRATGQKISIERDGCPGQNSGMASASSAIVSTL